VLFTNERTALDMAGFINTTMVRNFDFNDRYPGGHPSDCLGALFALAGAERFAGTRFLTGMVVMYEIFARISDAAKLSARGWDQGFAIGLSTAAGLSHTFGLSFEAVANAIGIIASSSVPLRVTRSGELSEWKNVATAYAVRNGIFAAILAAEGMEGPTNAFAGRSGLWEKVTGEFALAPFPNVGGPEMTPRVQLKYWPIETNGQPVVWAALDLRDRIKGGVKAIDVFSSKFTHFEIGSETEKWDPQNRETADHSLPYIFARAFVDGPIIVDSFDEDKVKDPALRPLMNKIKVIVDPEIDAKMPKTTVLRVVATAEDGSTHEVEVVNPLGHPDNPMLDRHINEKFALLAEPVVGAARSKAIMAACWGVRDDNDFGATLRGMRIG
jgi:2-methylcitrate dehydratase